MGRPGLPSVEQRWLKYYDRGKIQAELPKKTLFRFLFDKNADRMDAAALEYFGRKYTFAEFLHQVRVAAQAFHDIGIREGDVVTIASMHTPETVFCIYALSYLGAVANLVYVTLPEDELEKSIQETGSKAFLFLDLITKRVEKMKLSIPAVCLPVSGSMPGIVKLLYTLKAKPQTTGTPYGEFVRGKTGEVEECAFVPQRPVVIVHTSGSTGKPKGVVLSNENLNAFAFQYSLTEMVFEKGCTYMDIIPPFFGFGIGVGLHLPLTVGLTVILNIEPDVDKVTKAFLKRKPNYFVSGPVYVENIMGKIKGDLSFIKMFGGGGEAIAVDKELEVNRILREGNSQARYATGYGLTELGATVSTESNTVGKPQSIGIPLPHVLMKIVEPDTQRELGYNEVGEMWVRCENLMLGYYNDPTETDKVILRDAEGQRWFRTGDLGYVDEDGIFFFKGRLKRLYITKGRGGMVFKIFAQQVEEIVQKVEGVESCAMIAVHHPERENVAVIYYTSADKADLSGAIRESCEKKLAYHSVPVEYILVDELPYTASGKVDYRVLEKRYQESK